MTSAKRISAVSGTTQCSKACVATPRPSTADSTEIAAVMTPSPYKSAAPKSAASTTKVRPMVLVLPGTRASSAKMPPSPLLFARMMNAMYFTLTTIVSDQKKSESTPST